MALLPFEPRWGLESRTHSELLTPFSGHLPDHVFHPKICKDDGTTSKESKV